MQIDRALTAITTQLHGVPLKTGQTLAAIVLKADAATGKALLSLAGGQVAVQTNQALTAGSAIHLTVKDAGPPLVLTLAQQTLGQTPAQTTSQAPAQSAMRLNPPSNQTLVQTLSTQLLKQLGTSLTASASNAASAEPSNSPASASGLALVLPPQLRAALTSIDALLSPNIKASAEPTPPHGSLTGEQKPGQENLGKELARLINTLSLPTAFPAATGAPLPPNLKDELKRAAQQLKQAAALDTLKNTQPKAQTEPTTRSQPLSNEASASPPNASNANLQATLDQWLNRIDVSQLRTALQQLQGQPAWMIDVPILLHGQPQRLQLAIHEDNTQPTDKSKQSAWQLDFALNLPALGALHGSLRLEQTQQNPNDLTVRLYAETPQAQTELTAQIHELAEHLRAANLSPRELAIYLGPPPAAVTQRLQPNPTRLSEHHFEARV
ncbi:MAG: flagellar hook-length control protein FliK [Halothiobacillaceae bacterium]|nr:flagellar hook-length control protein FliK [Halothiobacillaceae bacterium]HUM99888.1 flagellar hook-length control protein FliK [Halothiobacillus sp.]